ncbi:transcription antitermination protein NusB [Crocinitomix algicola]|uniref:transcription antitermination protein NusB n=1 Tax=Crocinitomix algicola TaxID=1740263 RepID=UPI0008722B3A|nr:transcription antitermination protein NusB [Crocinitomix algicola]
MLNRRHLRIKVLQVLYAFFQTEDADILKTEKELLNSIERMYDLYLWFLLTFEEVHSFSEQRIEDRMKKVRPTEEDLNPNRKFVDNPILKLLIQNIELKRKSEEKKVNWTGAVENDIMRKLFLQIVDSEIYKNYMSSEDNSFENNRLFLIELFKKEIANFNLIHDYFENKNILWLDDIDLMCSMVLKTIKQFNEDDDEYKPILSLYKDKKDELDFVKSLIRETAQMDDENTELIEELTKNWEVDRIAKMDVILLKMALTELKVQPSIPKKVTLNEYIEISKYYSTPKSQVFINGILDKAIPLLEERGELKKTGRGLMN